MMIDLITERCSVGVGTQEGLCFDVGFHGDLAGLLQCFPAPRLHLDVLRDPLKNGGLTDCGTQQFLRGFWTKYAIENVKTNGKALEVSIEMDWILEALERSKQLMNCSRTAEYSVYIFLKKKAYPNVGN